MISFVFITGCGTTQTIVSTKIKTNVISPPDNLLIDCEITKPPSKSFYLESDWRGKEDLLVKNIKDQISNLTSCNTRISNVRQWIKDQKELYSNKEN